MILSLDGLCFHDFVTLDGLCFHDFVTLDGLCLHDFVMLDGLCFHDFVMLDGLCFHDFVARWSLFHSERFLQQNVFSRNIIRTNTSVFCRTQTLGKHK